MRQNAEAEARIEDAFAGIERRPGVWDVLLDGINTDERHRGADEDAFKLTYPFSPALVSTLRALASVMHRERTALKVMQQMLVDRRDTMTINEVIPVGDTFEYVVIGQGQPLTAEAAALFRSANKLYAEKIRPLLLSNNSLTEEDIDDGRVTPAFRADDRLAKTLLLSAVAPQVPALKSLTGGRLAALNHGSIVAPIPGGEASQVVAKIRSWARDVPEIHIGEGRDPLIRVQLADVDYESVVERAKSEDNAGRRRELLRAMVSESIGIDQSSPDLQGAYQHTVIWRGSKREVDVVFGNVRDSGWLSDDHFRARPGTWRIVMDHPFDEPGHSAAEDLQRLDDLTARGHDSRTIVWLPRFLSEEKVRDLRRLVILDYLLSGPGERWQTYADHLSEGDRITARAILDQQRNTLRRTLEDAVQQAYGAAAERPGTLLHDSGHDRILMSMDRSFAPERPIGATLGQAFDHLVSQAFDATYPGHPRFEPPEIEVKPRELRLVSEHIERAMAERDHRVPLEVDHAAVRRVANALGVGKATETHFLFGDDRFSPWGAAIERGLGARDRDYKDPVTVRELRTWIGEMTPPNGLRHGVADLVILGWAALRQRAWFQHGSPLPSVPRPGSLDDSMELRAQELPTESEWAVASERAGKLFGAAAHPYLTASAVATLAEDVRAKAESGADDAAALVKELEGAYRRLGIEEDAEAVRLADARVAASLTGTLRHLRGVDLVRRVASADLGERVTAVGVSLGSAREVSTAVRGFRWDQLAPLREARKGEGPRADQAARILSRLESGLKRDQVTRRLQDVLSTTFDAILDWLREGVTPPKPPVTPQDTPPPGPSSSPNRLGHRSVRTRDDVDVVVGDLRAAMEEHPDTTIEVEWRIVE